MFRRTLFACSFLVAAVALPAISHAQGRSGDQGPSQQDQSDDAAKKKRDKDWGTAQAPLKAQKNAGACPFVKVLYDAARSVDFKGAESASTVGYTGEIEGLSSNCRYRGGEPIIVDFDIGFAFGRGPAAEGQTNDYRYWVAVTDRNKAVLTKETFDLPVRFAPGQDRMVVTQPVRGITIPRADAKVTGDAFEVLVGFEVTAQQADFNREGKRFRVNAGATQASAAQ